jgi:predicted ester cyclase
MDALDDNKALVRRFYAEIDAGNLAAMDELVAPDYVDHDPPPIPGLAPGLVGLKQALEIFWKATPGTHEILDQVAESDRVATRIRPRGRFAEPLGEIPAPGGELDVTATSVYRVHDGKLVEHWGVTDPFAPMQQLGVAPTPGGQA